MVEFQNKLRKLEQQIVQFADDIEVLQRLNELDDANAQLNKVRYIAEGILHTLCIENEVKWGNKEPTLDRMIGPLRSQKVLTAPIAAHFRSIQSTCSPGSHFQKNQLTRSHTQIALLALVEVLEWYVTTRTTTHVPKEALPPQSFHKPWKWPIISAVIFLLIGGWWSYTPKDHPARKRTTADSTLKGFQTHFAKRHFSMTQLLQSLKSTAKPAYREKEIKEKLAEYRIIIKDYNLHRVINRSEIDRVYGKEIYRWEREIHHQLFYANKNLECLIRESGDPVILTQQAEVHLESVQRSFEKLSSFLHRLLDREEKWPIAVTRNKTAINPQLERPCPR